RLRQSDRLATEHEAVTGRKVAFEIAAPRPGAEEVQRTRAAAGEERLERLVHPYVDQVPVVHASALEGALVEREAERLHQMQDALRRTAGARDAARVGRDLGLDEAHMKGRRERAAAQLASGRHRVGMAPSLDAIKRHRYGASVPRGHGLWLCFV